MLSDLPSRITDKLVRTDDGHLLWTGGIRTGGYGHTSFNHKLVRVHRLVYEYVVGPLDDNTELHHSDECPKNCAEPTHMTPMTKAEHASLEHKGKNYETCRKGHDRSNARVRIGPQGQRWLVCRICKKERDSA